MVAITAGNFLMGISEEAAKANGILFLWYEDQIPQHNVAVKYFALAKYDVTKGEYAKFVKETGYSQTGCKTKRKLKGSASH
jgi:sulfatase modifying factor 1